MFKYFLFIFLCNHFVQGIPAPQNFEDGKSNNCRKRKKPELLDTGYESANNCRLPSLIDPYGMYTQADKLY